MTRRTGGTKRSSRLTFRRRLLLIRLLLRGPLAAADLIWETVFAVNVKETTTLRSLHNRLNQELSRLFGDVTALHDGDEYRFHLTVATGGATPETYQRIYEAYAQMPIAATFTAYEIVMFVYHEQPSGSRDYMTHTVLPLTGS